jgi:hypothetical protein
MAQHSRDTGLLLLGHNAMGSTRFRVGELVASLEHLEQGIALYDPQQHRPLALHYSVDPGVVCLCFAAHVLWLRGYPERALKMCKQALSAAQQPLHAASLSVALHFAAVLHHFRREPLETQDYADTALAYARDHQFSFWEAQAMLLYGSARAVQGDEEGMQQIQEGLTVFRTPQSMLAKLYPRSLAAEGLQVAAEGLELMKKGGECWWQAELYRIQGDLVLCQSIPDVITGRAVFFSGAAPGTPPASEGP